jgi:hypothetical protein
VFKVTKSGVLTVLHNFTGYPDDGAVPEFVGMLSLLVCLVALTGTGMAPHFMVGPMGKERYGE